MQDVLTWIVLLSAGGLIVLIAIALVVSFLAWRDNP